MAPVKRLALGLVVLLAGCVPVAQPAPEPVVPEPVVHCLALGCPGSPEVPEPDCGTSDAPWGGPGCVTTTTGGST